jgi:hypothetical protein
VPDRVVDLVGPGRRATGPESDERSRHGRPAMVRGPKSARLVAVAWSASWPPSEWPLTPST